MADDRHSVAETAPLLNDPDEIARREAENGIRQFDLALEIIRSFVKEPERPFRLRSSLILRLHQAAVDGVRLRQRQLANKTTIASRGLCLVAAELDPPFY